MVKVRGYSIGFLSPGKAFVRFIIVFCKYNLIKVYFLFTNEVEIKLINSVLLETLTAIF